MELISYKFMHSKSSIRACLADTSSEGRLMKHFMQLPYTLEHFPALQSG